MSLSSNALWSSAAQYSSASSTTLVLPNGTYSSSRPVSIYNKGVLQIVAENPGQAIIDAEFVISGVAQLIFSGINFAWTPFSGNNYKFQANSSMVKFKNCQGVSTATGGLFQAENRSGWVVDTDDQGQDTVWDFSAATISLHMADIDNGSSVYWRGGNHPGQAYRDRVVFIVPDGPDVGLHIANGTGHLVNFSVVGPGAAEGTTGIRFVRGWSSDVEVHATAPGTECGVVGFDRGILMQNESQVLYNGDVSPEAVFYVRDCTTGIEINGATAMIGQADVSGTPAVDFPGTTNPVVNYKTHYLDVDTAGPLVTIV